MLKDLSDIINSIRKNSGKPPIENIAETTSLRDDLGFDSFDLAEMEVIIEDRFGIDVFETGIPLTVSDVMEKLAINL